MKKASKETFDDMLSRCAWMTMQGIVKGEGIRSVMMTVFNIILGWQHEHKLLASDFEKKKGRK